MLEWLRRVFGREATVAPAPEAAAGLQGQAAQVTTRLPGYRAGRTETRITELELFIAQREAAGWTAAQLAPYRQALEREQTLKRLATGA